MLDFLRLMVSLWNIDGEEDFASALIMSLHRVKLKRVFILHAVKMVLEQRKAQQLASLLLKKLVGQLVALCLILLMKKRQKN